MAAIWTTERFDYLKELFNKGLSASLCALEMNKRFEAGYTRNAIIGKLSRSGLKRGGTNPPKTWARQWMPRQKKQPVRAEVPVISSPKDIMALEMNDCRYPVADGMFCAAPACERGSGSYCEAHAAICYRADNRSVRLTQKA